MAKKRGTEKIMTQKNRFKSGGRIVERECVRERVCVCVCERERDKKRERERCNWKIKLQKENGSGTFNKL